MRNSIQMTSRYYTGSDCNSYMAVEYHAACQCGNSRFSNLVWPSWFQHGCPCISIGRCTRSFGYVMEGVSERDRHVPVKPRSLFSGISRTSWGLSNWSYLWKVSNLRPDKFGAPMWHIVNWYHLPTCPVACQKWQMHGGPGCFTSSVTTKCCPRITYETVHSGFNTQFSYC